MPTVSAPAKVLVTGASGFIAVWVVKTLLDQGYSVVGTVRSKSKGEYLEKLFEKEGYGKDKFSFVIVEDIERDGAFDQAVVGVEAVEHTASPFHFKADDPQALIGPAVKGTVGVLESIKKYGPDVKRVVITSSVASVVHDKASPIYDETDWNTVSPKEVEEKGKEASGLHKYRASKTLAERAAWEFVEKNKGSIAFDVVTVCPPMVYGPIIHQVDSVESLNTSIAGFNSLNGKSDKELLAPAGNYVDVRDVASVHAMALGSPAAGGERFIASAGPFTFQDILDALHEAQPGRTDLPKGTPGQGKNAPGLMTFSSGKAEKTFGMKFKTMDEVAPTTLKSLKERGF